MVWTEGGKDYWNLTDVGVAWERGAVQLHHWMDRSFTRRGLKPCQAIVTSLRTHILVSWAERDDSTTRRLGMGLLRSSKSSFV